MAKKGSRSITVDDVRYRWRVKRTIEACLGFWNGAKYLARLTLMVELADEPRRMFVATIPAFLVMGFADEQFFIPPDIADVVKDPHEIANVSGLTLLSVKPGQVADIIRWARAEGWDPAKKGSPFIAENIHRTLSGSIFPDTYLNEAERVTDEAFHDLTWQAIRSSLGLTR